MTLTWIGTKPMPAHSTDWQMAELAIFIHGILFSFHVLGIAYNLRRRNWWDVAAHSCAATYDAHAVHHHLHQLQEITT